MHCPCNNQTLKKLMSGDTLEIPTGPVHLTSIKTELVNLAYVRYSES
jgi:hypothetical protein